jgi:hypothetical protein
MRKRISRQSLLQKFAGALGHFTDTELENLLFLLQIDGVAVALERLIQELVQLRLLERRVGSRLQRRTDIGSQFQLLPSRNQLVHASDFGLDFESSLRNTLVGVFSDHKLFPTMHDVIEAMNRDLECPISFEEFRKRGRRDAVGKCWSLLSREPKGRQVQLLHRFLNDVGSREGGMSAYKDLFSILTRYE